RSGGDDASLPARSVLAFAEHRKEVVGAVGLKQLLAHLLVADEAAEGADRFEVVAGHVLGRADDKQELHEVVSVFETDAGIASSHGENDSPDVAGARVRRGGGV